MEHRVIVDESVRRLHAGECTFAQLCERLIDMATPATAADMLDRLPPKLQGEFEWWLIGADGTSISRSRGIWIGGSAQNHNRLLRTREAFSRAILERREPV